MSGGKASRDKGCRFERSVVAVLQAAGLGGERIPLSGAAGGSFCGDITVPVNGIDRRLECKVRRSGFAQLYNWLPGNFALVIARDRSEPLVVMRLADFAALAKCNPDFAYTPALDFGAGIGVRA